MGMKRSVGIDANGADPTFHEAVELRRGDGVRQRIFHFRNRLPHGMDKLVHVAAAVLKTR